MQITVLRGRDAERRAVAGLLERTVRGNGGALLIHGRPGTGKSALIGYSRQAATGFATLATAGLAEEAGVPYAGVHRLLEPVLDLAAALPPAPARALSRALTGGGCAPGQRLALAIAVRDLLAAAGHDRPVLCTADDVDLLDPPSAQVLAFAARRLDRRPVALVLATGQDTGPGGVPALHLAELDDAASARLLADLLPPGVPDTVVAALTALAAGNPQALVDLAGTLTPGQCRGEERLPAALPPHSLLRQAYLRRLARLPAATRELLLLAALDDDLDAATLVRAASRAGLAIDALAPAERAGLVRVSARRLVFAHPLVRAIVRDEAPLAQRRAGHLRLAGVLDGQRDPLRRAVHLAAVASGPDPRLAAELERAVHARDTGPAGCLGTAGGCAAVSAVLEQAAALTVEPVDAAGRLVTAARYAWLAGHPERARRLLGGIPAGTAESLGPVVAGRLLLLRGEMELRAGAAGTAIELLLAAADLLTATRRDLALAALVRAGEAVCFTGDGHRFTELHRRAQLLAGGAAPADAAADFLFTQLTGVCATFRGDYCQGVPALRRVVALGERLDDAAALISASAASLLLTDDTATYRTARRAVETARAAGAVSLLPQALELRACAEYWLGLDEVAAQTSREGLRVARQIGQDNSAACHRGLLAVLAAIRGERRDCLCWIRELGDAPAGHSRPRAFAQWALAILDLVDGRCAAASARLVALADPFTGRGQVLVQVMATPYLVEAAVRGPDRPYAVGALEVFDAWAYSTGNPGRRAVAVRCHALLAERGSDAADEGFRAALRLHPVGGSQFERARTQLLYGRHLRRVRRPRHAREHLHAAYETFVRLGMPVWADQARAELRAAGLRAEPQPRAGLPAGPGHSAASAAQALTAQQLQVARLVAAGATNREVAAQLFLSTRTVDHHLRNIFSRLGLRSRTDLARVMAAS